MARYSADQEQYRLSFLYGSKACIAGSVRGCTDVGVLAYRGVGVPASLTRAFELWSIACAGGEQQACSYVGLLRLHGAPGVEVDVPLAIELFRKACDHESRVGCVGLGLVHELGLGLRRDFESALRAYLQGCDRGHTEACVRAGLLVEENSRLRRHQRAARELYETGCEGPPGGVCIISGRDGRYRARYSDEGFLRRSCDGADGRALACFNAGLALETDIRDEDDIEHAQDYFDRACRAGLKKSCRMATVQVLQ